MCKLAHIIADIIQKYVFFLQYEKRGLYSIKSYILETAQET